MGESIRKSASVPHIKPFAPFRQAAVITLVYTRVKGLVRDVIDVRAATKEERRVARFFGKWGVAIEEGRLKGSDIISLISDQLERGEVKEPAQLAGIPFRPADKAIGWAYIMKVIPAGPTLRAKGINFILSFDMEDHHC